MRHLILDLIENLTSRKNQEMKNIEMFKKNDVKDLILITSGKIMELDYIIQNLNEMLNYENHIKSTQK